jgi:hypothetical protein
MNEHIKTGEEIWQKVTKGSVMMSKEQWVSLSWLKEEIHKNDPIEFTAKDYKHWLLMLLEEK